MLTEQCDVPLGGVRTRIVVFSKMHKRVRKHNELVRAAITLHLSFRCMFVYKFMYVRPWVRVCVCMCVWTYVLVEMHPYLFFPIYPSLSAPLSLLLFHSISPLSGVSCTSFAIAFYIVSGGCGTRFSAQIVSGVGCTPLPF